MSEESLDQIILGMFNEPNFEEDVEAHGQLQTWALQTQNLAVFDSVLFQIDKPNAIVHLCVYFKMLFEKRGSLLSLPLIEQHFNGMCEFYSQKSKLINSTRSSRNEFALIFAISYRFFLQNSFQIGEPKSFDFIFEKLQGTNDERHIALVTLSSVVEDIKKNPYKMMESKHLEFRTFFYRNMLRQYFECTFPFLDDVNSEFIIDALTLLLKCLQFTTHHDDMLAFKFNVPGDWVDFYTDPTFPEKLFRIYRESKQDNAPNLALDSLLYFSSAVDSTWKAIDQHIAFIKHIAEQLTAAITSFDPEKGQRAADLEFARLICKIGIKQSYKLSFGISLIKPLLNL